MNKLLGEELAIESPRPQTTRYRVLGVYNRGLDQVVFVDTPGLFRGKRVIDRVMLAEARDAALDADTLLLMVDATRPNIGGLRGWLEQLNLTWTFGVAASNPEQADSPVDLDNKPTRPKLHLLVNKVDRIKKPGLLTLTQELSEKFPAAHEYWLVSARTGEGLDDLLTGLAAALPEGPKLFEGQVRQPDALFFAEITRERCFQALRQDVPMQIAVETEKISKRCDGGRQIRQVILVRTASQKAILVGRGGSFVKQVGSEARKKLERLLGCRVDLMLFVRVEPNWANDAQRLCNWYPDRAREIKELNKNPIKSVKSAKLAKTS